MNSYYAIIPATVRYDKRLKPIARLLYGELTALSNEKGYCWASNRYFAELYEVALETISRLISQLRELGYIKITYDKNAKDNDRRIYINDFNNIKSEEETETKEEETSEETEQEEREEIENLPLTKKSNTLDEKVKLPLTKKSSTLDEKVKHNNTCINTCNTTERETCSLERSFEADFEKFTDDFIIYAVKLLGIAVSDIKQLPYFRNHKNYVELKSIFEARRYDYRQCLEFAFDIAITRQPDKRFFSFYDTLKIYLQNGNGKLIARYYTDAELENKKNITKQIAEAEKSELERRQREEMAEAEKLGLTLEEYQLKVETEDLQYIEHLKRQFQYLQKT